MGKAEDRKEPTFPLSYWNDAVDIDLGPLPEHLKRPEQRGEEQARKEVASMAQTAVDQAMQQEAQPNSQRGKTWASQEAAPSQPEAPPAKETKALALGQELQAKYPQGVTLRTALEFEEFACYIDYVRQVQQLRNRAAGLGSSSPAEPVTASTGGAPVLAVPPSPAGPR